MEHITRRFMLFQGVAIGILVIIHAITTIYHYIAYPPYVGSWDYYSDIHGLQEVIIPMELCWVIAAGSLLHGIYRSDIRFFYPIILTAIGAIVVQLVREFVLFWFQSTTEYFWSTTLFCNPPSIISLICSRIHGMMTLIALKRLFETEQNADFSFVRFHVESDVCEANEGSRNR